MNENKNLNIQEYELPVVLRDEDGGFLATCPIWKDCYAQGDTVEDAISEISYVASSLIELYKEEGMEVPLKLKSTTRQGGNDFSISVPVIVSSL